MPGAPSALLLRLARRRQFLAVWISANAQLGLSAVGQRELPDKHVIIGD